MNDSKSIKNGKLICGCEGSPITGRYTYCARHKNYFKTLNTDQKQFAKILLINLINKLVDKYHEGGHMSTGSSPDYGKLPYLNTESG